MPVDGLEALVTLVHQHLIFEEAWRRTGDWPCEDAPHGPAGDKPHPVTTARMRRRWPGGPDHAHDRRSARRRQHPPHRRDLSAWVDAPGRSIHHRAQQRPRCGRRVPGTATPRSFARSSPGPSTPYRIRRRTDDEPQTLAVLAERGHTLQEQMAESRAWVAGESSALSEVLDGCLADLARLVGRAYSDAWRQPPSLHPPTCSSAPSAPPAYPRSSANPNS
jgi:hypothetical protein